MYLGYFGLTERPFSIAPDPQYLYMSKRHKEAMAHLSYGLTQGGCFIVLTGEVGTGKTTLCRNLLNDLPGNVDVALILNANINEQELLQTVCDELSIDRQGDESQKQLLDKINQSLLTAFAAGRQTVLIIDEAQLLSRDVLEHIRLLTNLETTKSKLLQIILIGQPELNDLLSRNDLRQLAQRVTAKYHLGSLQREEIEEYVNFRLARAGCKQPLFSRQALNQMHKMTDGIPRKINVLADHALLSAYANSLRLIDAKTIKQATKDVFVSTQPKARTVRPAWLTWWWAMPLLIVLNVGLWAWFTKYGAGSAESSVVQETAPQTQSTSSALARQGVAESVNQPQLETRPPETINSSGLSSLSQQADGSLPQQADGSLPQQADGSLPQQADGSLPQQADGSLPQQADGSLPQQADGSLPQQLDRAVNEFDEQVILDEPDSIGASVSGTESAQDLIVVNTRSDITPGTVEVSEEFLDASPIVDLSRELSAPTLSEPQPKEVTDVWTSSDNRQSQNLSVEKELDAWVLDAKANRASDLLYNENTALGRVLETSADVTGRIQVLKTLASQWQVNLSAPLLRTPCRELAEQGLRCVTFDSWNRFERLNRPGILVVKHKDQLHRVLVQSVFGENARILVGDQYYEVPLVELLSRWTNKGILVWRPSSVGSQFLQQGSNGASVTQVRARLNRALAAADLPLLNNVSSAEFDLDMAQKVFALQARFGISQDSKIGLEVYFLLNEILAPQDTLVLAARDLQDDGNSPEIPLGFQNQLAPTADLGADEN